MKLVTVIPRRFGNKITNDIIVEVKSAVYLKLLEVGVLQMPWRECKVIEHLYLKRCFKCCGYSHIASQCKQNTVFCSKCAGNHSFKDCKNKKICCINCKVANDKYKSKLDTNHHPWSRECKILDRRMTKLRNKIEYNPAD